MNIVSIVNRTQRQDSIKWKMYQLKSKKQRPVLLHCGMCVCVCVCERERERERHTHTQTGGGGVPFYTAQVYTHARTHPHTRTCARAHTHPHTTYTHIHIYTRAYSNTHPHKNVHAHIHPRANIPPLPPTTHTFEWQSANKLTQKQSSNNFRFSENNHLLLDVYTNITRHFPACTIA